MLRSTLAGIALLAGFACLRATGQDLAPSAAECLDDAGLQPPQVRIVDAKLVTRGNARRISLSCALTNPNPSPILFKGYDSFDPPLPNGRISPIFAIQLRRDGEWQNYPQGWCGTGLGDVLWTDGNGAFSCAVPADSDWEAARVGVLWRHPPLPEDEEAGGYSVAWSAAFDPRAAAE